MPVRVKEKSNVCKLWGLDFVTPCLCLRHTQRFHARPTTHNSPVLLSAFFCVWAVILMSFMMLLWAGWRKYFLLIITKTSRQRSTMRPHHTIWYIIIHNLVRVWHSYINLSATTRVRVLTDSKNHSHQQTWIVFLSLLLFHRSRLPYQWTWQAFAILEIVIPNPTVIFSNFLTRRMVSSCGDNRFAPLEVTLSIPTLSWHELYVHTLFFVLSFESNCLKWNSQQMNKLSP